MILEACVENLDQALLAEKLGAKQIELCGRLDLDGLSPTADLVKSVCKAVRVPVKVMINPFAYRYCYTKSELDSILRYIEVIQPYEVAGLVFGPVTSLKDPDLKALRLVKSYTGLQITFHKAIDASPNILKATQSLIGCGDVDYILSSGGEVTAQNGMRILLEMKYLLEKSESNIQLIAAGRIKKNNISHLHEQLDLKFYHGKLIVGDLD